MNDPIRLDLVYFDGCPHVPRAHQELDRLIEDLGRNNFVLELRDTSKEQVNSALACWPSPTVLVNGEAVCGETQASEKSCHVMGEDYWGRLRSALEDRVAMA